MDIKRNGSHPTRYGPADSFTGTVRIDSPFEAPDPARVGGASVTFEPGARTAWHSHPLRPDADRDDWPRSGSTLGRADPGDSPWGRDLV